MVSLANIGSVVLLALVLTDAAVAQVDSIVGTDSVDGYSIESVVEQSEAADDSPVLDYIARDYRTQQSAIQVRSRFTQALQQSKGITSGAYLGSSTKSYQRLKFFAGEHLRSGIVLEKDAGEQHFNDFISANVMVSNLGLIRNAVLGDFYIESGQGLGLWRGYDFSKGAEVILPVRRDAKGLGQYLSSDENSFLRGAAVEFQLGKVISSLFHSNTARSASLDSLGRVTSMYASGYFRTATEQEKKNSLTEILFGASLHYHLSDGNTIGGAFYRTRFSHQLFFNDGRTIMDEGYSFSSVDYNFSLLSTSLFGEWGRSNSIIGGISGFQITPTQTINLIVAARHYPSRFVSLHGLGFGERSSNEDGIYFGVQFKPSHYLHCSSYYDQFRSADPASNRFSQSGHDVLVQCQMFPFSRWQFTLRYHGKITNVRLSRVDGNGFTHLFGDDQRKQQVRIDVEDHLSKNVNLRCRLERLFLHTRISDTHENGLLTFQELRYESSEKFWFNVRVVYFKTDSYESGIAEYENDMPGVLSLPVLYGTGIRWYFLIRYHLTGALNLSAKYSDMIRDDVKRVGSGLDELPSNHDSRIGVQVDIRW